MKLKEIAEKIDAYLKRFESDETINVSRDGDRLGLKPYYQARAYVAGRYVAVTYVSFQHTSNLTKAEALEYLAWLDDGNVGKHFKAFTLRERLDRLGKAEKQ